ncbi:MAG: HTTM domain-containing protein [Bacteroidia bacterium]
MEVKSSITKLKESLTVQVENKYLSLFRILFFGFIALELIQFRKRDYFQAFLVDARVRFPYEFFPFDVEFTAQGFTSLFAITLISAVFCSAGLFFRYSKWVFTLSFGFLFFQDKMLWNNHWYLFFLVGFLALFMKLENSLSLDALVNPKIKNAYSPRWYFEILKLQIFVVYFFAGIAKLNYDWLVETEPIGTFIKQRENYFLLGWLFSIDSAKYFFAYSGIIYDLCIGFLLFSSRFKKLGIVLTFIFNIINSIIFDIGMFPFIMLACNYLFVFQHSIDEKKSHKNTKSTQQLSKPIMQNGLFYFLIFYSSFQLIFPMRQFLYKGNPSWIGICERFSWRMMIQNKVPVKYDFYISEKSTGKNKRIDLRTFLFPPQIMAQVVFPDMIPQTAMAIQKDAEKAGLINPEIKAEIIVSLNKRKPQSLVDSTLNLSEQKADLFKPPLWVVPLKE